MSADRPLRILFLSHSAGRNGASLLLLHFLQWLRSHSEHRLEVLCQGSGPLIDEYRAVARTRVWRSPSFLLNALPARWSARLRPWLDALALRLRLLGRRYDLVYANTAATAEQVAVLAPRSGALLWHVHELSYALRLAPGEKRLRQLFPWVARFVAVSDPVVEALVEFGAAEDRIDKVHGFVPPSTSSPAQIQAKRERVLAALGWPASAFVVGGCGGLGWRKGSDLFLQLARLLDDVYFLWVGGGDPEADPEALRFAHEIRALGLEGRCHHLRSTSDVDEFYCAMDLFALTSREDPYPLVMLEAGTRGVPTVCFAASGGGPEFVGDDAGLVAPYLDVEGFVGCIESLRSNPELRRKLGDGARHKVNRSHVVETQGPELLASIERCFER